MDISFQVLTLVDTGIPLHVYVTMTRLFSLLASGPHIRSL